MWYALALLVCAVAITAVCRRLGLSAPIVLVVTGLLVSLVPGVPHYELDAELVLFVVLPPLLYAAALDSSYLKLRANLGPILFLSVGLVIVTAVVVGLVMHTLLPGLPLAAAMAFGAIVAPPDAVAATTIGRRLGMPRRVVTILAGESLVNDATALTFYRVAVATAVGGGFSLLTGILDFARAGVGGVAVGLALAIAVHAGVRRFRDPLIENTVALLLPFFAYSSAEAVDASGVLAVVVAGLYIGHRSHEASFATRLQARAVWAVVALLFESVAFALIGLQLMVVLDDIAGYGPAALAAYALAAFGTVVAVRFGWVFAGAYVPWLLPRLRQGEPQQPWRSATVISWAGMRGVVSLAAAFALPHGNGEQFPGRAEILFLTFCVVLGTLLLQGLTLPRMIQRLGLRGCESYQDDLAEAAAQQEAARLALERLDAVVAEEGISEDVAGSLRRVAERRQLRAWERLGGGVGPDSEQTPTNLYRRLRREMLETERSVFVEMRDRGEIDDEVLRRVMHELDLEEAILDRD